MRYRSFCQRRTPLRAGGWTYLWHIEQLLKELVHLPQLLDPETKMDQAISIETGEREDEQECGTGEAFLTSRPNKRQPP